MKDTIWFFSFETLGRIHKNIFLYLFIYLFLLTKTGYFNTRFDCYGAFTWNGPTWPNKKNGPAPAQHTKWASTGPKKYNRLVTVLCTVTSQLTIMLQNVNCSRSACKMKEEKTKESGAVKERRVPGVGGGCCRLRRRGWWRW